MTEVTTSGGLGVFVPKIFEPDPDELPVVAEAPGPWVPERSDWTLSAEHVSLGAEHAVLPEVMAEHCYTDPTNGYLAFLWTDGDRQVPQHRIPEADRREDGPKYLFPSGVGKVINHLRTGSADSPLLLVEGSFQSLAAKSWAPESYGIAAIAGCANWDLPGLLKVVEHRDVVVFLDADAVENPDVWFHGYKRLTDGLKEAGAAKIRFHESSGSKKAGLDDDLAALPEEKRHDVIGRMVAASKPRLNKPSPRRSKESNDAVAQRLVQSVDFSNAEAVVFDNEPQAYEWLKAEIPKTESFFVRGGQLVHMIGVTDSDYVQPESTPEAEQPEWYRMARNGSSQVAVLNKYSLRSRIQSGRSFLMWSGTAGAHVPKLFPKDPVEMLIGDPEPLRGVRPLRGIVAAPMFLRGNRILQTPGYDTDSGFYYVPDDALRSMRQVSDAPTTEELRYAQGLIDLMLWDFPFVTPQDKATYAGYLFLPLLKDLIPPPYKMLGINAPTKGSGKGYLSAGLTTVHHGPGGGIFRAGLPVREEERAKYITTILSVTAGDMVVFDNVRSEIRGQALEFLMTSAIWNDRELGANRQIHEVNDRIWVANGNNLQVSGDMARRVALSSIDTGMENPQDRTRYRIKEETGLGFLEFVAAYRGELLWSLLTLIRGWYLAGQQRPTADTSDNFGLATSVIRGILAYAGLTGVGEFDSKSLRIVGNEDSDLGRFLTTASEWQAERCGGRAWDAETLKQDCAGVNNKWEVDLSDIPGLGEASAISITPRQFKAALKAVAGRPAAGLKLVRHVDSKDKPWFMVVPVG